MVVISMKKILTCVIVALTLVGSAHGEDELKLPKAVAEASRSEIRMEIIFESRQFCIEATKRKGFASYIDESMQIAFLRNRIFANRVRPKKFLKCMSKRLDIPTHEAKIYLPRY